MSAIAIDLPDDVVAARDGIVAFAEQEVIPRHQLNHELFENPRALYREDGRFSDALIKLIRATGRTVKISLWARPIRRSLTC